MEILEKAKELGAPEDGLVEAQEISSALERAVSSGEALFSLEPLQGQGRQDRDQGQPGRRQGQAIDMEREGEREASRPFRLELGPQGFGSAGLQARRTQERRARLLQGQGSRASRLSPRRGTGPRARERAGLSSSRSPSSRRTRPPSCASVSRGIRGLAQALPSLAEFPIDQATKIALVQPGRSWATSRHR